jgi:homoserine O-acetyltransferase
MPDKITDNSVGLIAPISHHFDQPLTLASGKVLPAFDVVYETYGELNSNASNAILICHALSGDHHAAGYHSMDDAKAGWWDNYIGPGKVIDTNKFFVVSPNNIGGCAGSTGPASINPETARPWGASFPRLRARDWVNVQARLADVLGIQQWAAVIGGSLGGMQAMRWSLEYPDRLRHCIVIASAMKLTAQNLAFNEIARQAITSDLNYHNGDYLAHDTSPEKGLALARMIGHVTYLSDGAMGEKFGRDLRSGSFELGQDSDIEFQVQSYLRHQGKSFTGNFDANTYILMTQALDYFDLAREYDDDAAKAFARAQCKFLVVSFTSDWRFAPERSREIVNALIAAGKSVSYGEIESSVGHDAFLLPNARYEKFFDAYLNNIIEECGGEK